MAVGLVTKGAEAKLGIDVAKHLKGGGGAARGAAGILHGGGGGGGFRVEVKGLREAIQAIRALPSDLRRELRRELRKAAAEVAADARRRASWSTRIPRAITYGADSRGAYIRARSTRAAPHATLYERPGGFRHPLFGDRQHWYPQPSRPYLRPAAAAGEGTIEAAARRATDRAIHDAGL